ncbi:MAG: hypothetical protein HC802_04180 [Caldilineaceae bacterium]|nr:hypothetical protein [Caldilineaceae bacterium]
MITDNRRDSVLRRRDQLMKPEHGWRQKLRPSTVLTNVLRIGFLFAVVAVLAGVWIVSSAHLREQFLGVPETTEGLLDPTAGQGALTPDNIEKQVLAFSLRLREAELALTAGGQPAPAPLCRPAG